MGQWFGTSMPGIVKLYSYCAGYTVTEFDKTSNRSCPFTGVITKFKTRIGGTTADQHFKFKVARFVSEPNNWEIIWTDADWRLEIYGVEQLYEGFNIPVKPGDLIGVSEQYVNNYFCPGNGTNIWICGDKGVGEYAMGEHGVNYGVAVQAYVEPVGGGEGVGARAILPILAHKPKPFSSRFPKLKPLSV